jgi:hypothetical protein
MSGQRRSAFEVYGVQGAAAEWDTGEDGRAVLRVALGPSAGRPWLTRAERYLSRVSDFELEIYTPLPAA